MSEREFSRAMDQINNTLNDYWPCHLCFCCGYTCCACTLGLSLFCPNLCISDVSPRMFIAGLCHIPILIRPPRPSPPAPHSLLAACPPLFSQFCSGRELCAAVP